jgi:hypothetical protein
MAVGPRPRATRRGLTSPWLVLCDSARGLSYQLQDRWASGDLGPTAWLISERADVRHVATSGCRVSRRALAPGSGGGCEVVFPPSGIGMVAGGERAHNLPVLRVPHVGRDEHARPVRGRVLAAEQGLLTLTGAGVSGKTSLALHIAASLGRCQSTSSPSSRTRASRRR